MEPILNHPPKPKKHLLTSIENNHQSLIANNKDKMRVDKKIKIDKDTSRKDKSISSKYK